MRTFDAVNNRYDRYAQRLAENRPAKKNAGKDIAAREMNRPVHVAGTPGAC